MPFYHDSGEVSSGESENAGLITAVFTSASSERGEKCGGFALKTPDRRIYTSAGPRVLIRALDAGDWSAERSL